MIRFLKTSLMTTLAIASVAGTAYAAGLHGGRPGGLQSHDKGTPDTIIQDQPMTGGSIRLTSFNDNSSRRADAIIRHWRGAAFDVQPVGQIDDDETRAALQDRRTTEPREVAALQSAIHGNHRLVKRLRADNVEISNIVGADAAMNGSLTLYVE